MIGEFGLAGSLEVGDVDRDGRPELVSLADSGFFGGLPRWQIHEYDGEVRQTWSSLPLEGQPRFLRLLPRPSGVEILVFWDSVVKVFDGGSRRLLREIQLPGAELRAARIGDLEGDGDQELVLSCALDLFVLDPASGELLADKPGFGGTDLDLGQIDGDPQAEIAIGGNGFGGLILDGISLAVDWADLTGFGERVRMVDVDADGMDEIVATSESDELVRAIDVSTGETLWEQFLRFPTVLEAEDLDGDGRLEVLVASGLVSGVQVLDPVEGELSWAVESPTGAAGAAVVADLDRDGVRELVWSTRLAEAPAGGSLSVVDTVTRAIEYTAPDLRGPLRGLGIADLDLNGRNELVAATESGSAEGDEAGRLLTWIGDSGTLVRVGEPLESGGFGGYKLGPVVASQLDADPQPEICLAITSPNRIRCEDGLSHEVHWEVPIPDGAEGLALLAGQLDEDPSHEVIVATSASKVLAFEGDSGWLKWGSPQLQESSGPHNLRIGNVIGDSRIEILAGGAGGFPSALALIDAQSGLLALPEIPWTLGIEGFELAEIDGDPEIELLVSRDNGDIVAFDPVTQTFGAPIASFEPTILAFRFGDVTRDDVPDLILTRFQGGLLVWDGAAGAVTWTSPWLGDRPGLQGSLWIGDFDDDSISEIAVSMEAALAVFEAPLVALLRADFETGDTSEWSSTQP